MKSLSRPSRGQTSYHPLVRSPSQIVLPLNQTLLRPGTRLAVGLSGGADSVALLRSLAARASEAGLVLHAAHLHHGLRGAEADEDLEFCRELAASLGVPFHEAQVDTQAEAQARPKDGKAAETIEEAARRLRYGWFRRLMVAGEVDAVATAHTLDDQAETVLARFLRGAWTEGLAGIHPVIEFPEGRILRPLLGTGRAEVEAYLHKLGQDWREDSSNRHLTYTRNRIRHQLLPLLETWNPRLRKHLARMAVLARDEEAWWDEELRRRAPEIVMSGRPVRGGGRAAGPGVAIDAGRLAELAPALQRRMLRRACSQLGGAPDFESTESLRTLALEGRAGQRLQLASGLLAERTPRELRLAVLAAGASNEISEYKARIPGEILAPAFGLRLRIEAGQATTSVPVEVTLRNWKAGDRVRLRHSSAPRKVKEVLERMRVTGTSRGRWPVLEAAGRIVWMQGVDLEPEPEIAVHAETLDAEAPNPEVEGT